MIKFCPRCGNKCKIVTESTAQADTYCSVCDASYNVQVICVDWFEHGRDERFAARFGISAAELKKRQQEEEKAREEYDAEMIKREEIRREHEEEVVVDRDYEHPDER